MAQPTAKGVRMSDKVFGQGGGGGRLASSPKGKRKINVHSTSVTARAGDSGN